MHIDWYYDTIKELWVFAVIDDASRYLLALLEVQSATTENSIKGMKQALKYGRIKQCISDHGTQFIYVKPRSNLYSFWFFTYIRLFDIHLSGRSACEGIYHYCGSYQAPSNHKSAVLILNRASGYEQYREPMMPYVFVKLDM